MSLLLGIVAAAALAYPAYRRGALSESGLAAALVVGALIIGLGGPAPGLALCAFFLSGTALSRWRRSEKQRAAGDTVDKGDRRDWAQVLANGGAAALCCAGFDLSGREDLRAAALGALAAAAADTWATEIGLLARGRPRHLLSLAPAPPGTSGAVTPEGLLGMAAGALFIALVAALAGAARHASAALLGGIGGALLDSLLGATLQERRACLRCGAPTEQRWHRCGGATCLTGGVAGLDNDWVNVLATAGGGVLALLASRC